MDWSLVLASQAIEATIDCGENGSGWGLIVPAEDLDKAVTALRQYHLENRHWGWARQVVGPGLLFDWTSVLWAGLLGIFFWISEVDPGFRLAGIMTPVKVGHGEWWRLFTSIWLHADASHLAANAGLGLVFLGLVMGRYGAGLGLLASYLAGVGGNLLVWIIGREQSSLGASGAVMGALGLLAAQSFSKGPRSPYETKVLISGLLGGLMLFVLFGLSPESDVRAHAGGFVSGVLMGAVLARAPHAADKVGLNVWAGLSFLALVVFPWYEALLHR